MDPRLHIVVVEDEAAQPQLLADYLAGQNFRVSAVDSSVALHRLVERDAPALVLLDVGLPGEDGFALARRLRERSSRVGIIRVTLAADTVDRVVGRRLGPTTTSPNRSSHASCWPGSGACCVAAHPRASLPRRGGSPPS